MGQTSLISNFDDGIRRLYPTSIRRLYPTSTRRLYTTTTEFFLARTHVEASLRDGLIKSVILFLPQLYGTTTPKRLELALPGIK